MLGTGCISHPSLAELTWWVKELQTKEVELKHFFSVISVFTSLSLFYASKSAVFHFMQGLGLSETKIHNGGYYRKWRLYSKSNYLYLQNWTANLALPSLCTLMSVAVCTRRAVLDTELTESPIPTLWVVSDGFYFQQMMTYLYYKSLGTDQSSWIVLVAQFKWQDKDCS